jgi:hypothetical protein
LNRHSQAKTFDKLEQLLIQKESEYWKNTLNRLFKTAFYTAENNMAFWVSRISYTYKITENILASFNCWQNSILELKSTLDGNWQIIIVEKYPK